MYYGAIEEEEYNRLFDRLKELMMRRFSQKKEENIELPVLEEYRALLRNLILKKEACLFVIYHDSKPIDICMNLVYDNIVTSYNSSYDIDYEAFSLGSIDLMKHIEWCFEQGFDIFDMGRGDYLYKRRWTNYKYSYQRQMIYNPSSFYPMITSNLKMHYNQLKYNLIQFLKKFGVQHLYGKYYQLHYLFLRKSLHVALHKKYNVEELSEAVDPNTLTTIDINAQVHQWLLKPVNDFIYKTHEKFRDVQVTRSSDRSKTYYLKGTKTSQRITLLD